MPGHMSFDETWMGAGDTLVTSSIPGFGAGNRTPKTSRVERRTAKAAVRTSSVKKGLARSCVSVKWDGDTATVRVKGSLSVLGTLKRVKKGVYTYKLDGQPYSQGYPSQVKALGRMLELV